jgi:hypothetical protein
MAQAPSHHLAPLAAAVFFCGFLFTHVRTNKRDICYGDQWQFGRAGWCSPFIFSQSDPFFFDLSVRNMKLFQKLLLAPACLGLLAPLATEARASDAMADYVRQMETDAVKALMQQMQVTSINQFSDVRPTDWAYQALSNLIERYGCVAGYPDGSFRGGRAMSRYEAAALLNACLDRISEVTDELKRLMKEFEKELAVLRGRVDGLEAKVGELEASQFSTTTKLRGKVEMVVGGTSYTGDYGRYDNLETRNAQGSAVGPQPQEAVSFNYRTTLSLDTSFTGKDLLYTRLRSGNYNNSAFGGNANSYVPLAMLDVANSNDDVLKIDKLWYNFPVFGRNGMVFVGPRIENYYMLASQPTVYGQGDFILKYFKDRGAPGVYGNSSGAGAGFWLATTPGTGGERLSWSNSYVARDGSNGNPIQGGIGTDHSEGKFVSQLAYGSRQWQISTAYAYTQANMTMGRGTPLGAQSVRPESNASSWALNAFWQPSDSGWIPSLSLGYEISWFNSEALVDGARSQSQSWMAGLQWDDAFAEGNGLGFGIGGAQWLTALKGGDTPDDGNMLMELWYRFQVTDNISITPALFYLSRPFGQLTGSSARYGGVGTESFGTLGYLVKSTFRF